MVTVYFSRTVCKPAVKYAGFSVTFLLPPDSLDLCKKLAGLRAFEANYLLDVIPLQKSFRLIFIRLKWVKNLIYQIKLMAAEHQVACISKDKWEIFLIEIHKMTLCREIKC